LRDWYTHREPVVELSLAASLNAAGHKLTTIHAFGESYFEALLNSQYLTSLVIGSSSGLESLTSHEFTDTTRGDRTPKSKANQQFLSNFDGLNDEHTIGSSKYIASSVADYSSNSYRSSIVTARPLIADPYHKPRDLQCANFKGGENKPDGKLFDEVSLAKKLMPAATKEGSWDYHEASVVENATKDTKMSLKLHRSEEAHKYPKASVGFNKPSYPVLIGNNVVVCETKLFASLPLHDKYIVKERVQCASGVRAKLVLKSTFIEKYVSGYSYNKILWRYFPLGFPSILWDSPTIQLLCIA